MEDNLKKIVSVAARLCREKSIQANPHTIAYAACLQDAGKMLEDVGPGTSVLGELTPEAVAAVSERVFKQLRAKDDPLLAAARMQIMMEVAFTQQRDVLSREAMEKEERIDMLKRAVTETKAPAGVTGHERMFARVLEYVSVAGGMELAVTDDVAKEEVRVAMESIFPLSTLVRFSTLSSEERQQQIESLARMTVGICLFNQTLGRGGSALPPGPASYLPQANRLLRDISRHITSLSADVAAYAALVRINTASDDKPETEESKTTRQRAIAESVHKSQALVMWEGLREDLAAGLQAVSSLDKELQHWIMQVHDTVGSASAVPKEAVLPAFERLGAIHQALGDELRMLVVRHRLSEELTSLMDGYVTLLQRISKTRRPGKKTPVEIELASWQLQRASWVPQAPENMSDGCVWEAAREPNPASSAPHADASTDYLIPSGTPNTDSTGRNGHEVVEVYAGEQQGEGAAQGAGASGLPPGLALNGFDPVLLGSQGCLSRADATLGFITYNGNTYGFSSPESMATFAASPASALTQVHAEMIRRPTLARLLGRSSAFPALNLPLIVQALAGPLKVDFGCQTPTHFVDRHIDYSYEWNEWALRRRALALANLRQKRTHGTQTGLSHFKRDAESQVWQPKSAQVQTRVNKGQAMPKKLQYVAGLRGSPATKMNVIRLELDLGQPHQY